MLALGCALLACAGCAGAGRSTPRDLQLQRTDLAAVAHALRAIQPSVRREVLATKAAWPLVAHGLPADVAAVPRSRIDAAVARAAAIRLPALFAERPAVALTGPGSHLAGLLRNFSVLSARSWRLIGAALDQIQHGSTAAARFARANVALYVDSVYDAHFGLAQIGRLLLAGYQKLGGAGAFRSSLTQAQVDALVRAYSEGSDRLYPHPSVRVGREAGPGQGQRATQSVLLGCVRCGLRLEAVAAVTANASLG